MTPNAFPVETFKIGCIGRGEADLPSYSCHHPDSGSQYLSIRYTERLADAGIDTSVGSVGDSYDCEYGIAA